MPTTSHDPDNRAGLTPIQRELYGESDRADDELEHRFLNTPTMSDLPGALVTRVEELVAMLAFDQELWDALQRAVRARQEAFNSLSPD